MLHPRSVTVFSAGISPTNYSVSCIVKNYKLGRRIKAIIPASTMNNDILRPIYVNKTLDILLSRLQRLIRLMHTIKTANLMDTGNLPSLVFQVTNIYLVHT